MTSHRYLSNKKKGAAYSFFSALKTVLLPTGMLAVFYALIFGVVPYLFLYNYTKPSGYDTTKVLDAAEKYKFVIFPENDFFITFVVFAVVTVLCLFTGIIIFRFAADKRTVNVYYSLGVKRTTLFYTRFVAGALALCAATAIGIIVSYLVNVAFVKPSWQLSLVLFYFYCGLSLFQLVIYSVTAAVFASVGTISEGILYSVGILGLPTVIFLSAQNLIAAFLDKAPYGSYVREFALTYADGFSYDSTQTLTLLEQYMPYNPILFFANALNEFGVGIIEDGKVFIGCEENAWHLPSVFTVLPWFFVVVAVALLGGLVFFKYRKAEHCGFLNTNRVLSTFVLIELMFFAACIPVSEAQYSELSVVLGFGALLMLLMYVGFEIFLERNVKLFFKKLYKLPATAAVIVGIFAVFMTGGLGYDGYITDADNVTSVTLALPVSISGISTMSEYNGSMPVGFISASFCYNEYTALPEIKDKATVDMIVDVHKSVNENKDSDGCCKFYVKYTLKNGTQCSRMLTAGKEDMKKLLTAYDSPECKAAFADLTVNRTIPDTVPESEAAMTGLAQFDYRFASVTAISGDMYSGNELNLSKEEFTALKNALVADINARSALDYYEAKDNQLGVLRFSSNLSIYGYTDFETEIFDEPATQPEQDDEIYDKELNEYEDEDDIFTQPEEKPENTRLDEVYGPFSLTGDYFYGDESQHFDVIIDASMKNTLNFLKSINAGDCFEGRKKIAAVSFEPVNSYTEFTTLTRSGTSREFFASSISNGMFWELTDDYLAEKGTTDKDFENNYSENHITDSAKIKELDSLMRVHAYTFGEGYFCLVRYDDGTYSTRYLPQNVAPDYVKNYSYALIPEQQYLD